jgi:coenzyme F420-reducing hydrogenase delta subunit
MFNMSAVMAAKFVEAATEMTERIAGLGPNRLRAAQIEGQGE